MPKFVCILPVRDEADIIPQCLDALLGWSDAIYVFDTGSVDESWEIANDYASRNDRVIPLRKEAVYFSETRLRGWMFHQARESMRDGDWFLRVDADEFHHIPPPEFVRSCLRKHESLVYHQYYDFRLTESELKAWERGQETLADRARPIAERRRYYTPSSYAEPRLCKYRNTMQWPETVSFPFNAGYVARGRLPIRHYPHRDPLQLERRCRLRAIMMADAENRKNWEIAFHYWQEREWRKFITLDDAPGLRCWEAGAELPLVHQTNHLRSPVVRGVQRLLHAVALPLLDKTRRQFAANAVPQRIPTDVCRRLEVELAMDRPTFVSARKC